MIPLNTLSRSKGYRNLAGYLPNHSDNLLIAQVKEQFDNGLLSAEEVILTIQGKML
jgi:hypothetical protein